MSLILDALKRAEKERETILSTATTLPAVATPLLAPNPSGKRLVIGGIALLVVALAIWGWKSRAPVMDTAPAEIEAPADETVADDVDTEIAEIETIEADAAPMTGSESITSLDDLTEPEDAALVAEPVAPIVATSPPPASAVVEPAPVVEPKPAVAAVAPPAPAAGKILPLRDMPPSYRAEFPDLSIQVHSYDNDVAARFVRIGGYRYKQGETLAEGPRLLEIVNNGLVFEYRGERVLYPLN